MIESKKQLLDYKNYRHFSDTFIETGSAAGDGIQRALAADFQEVRSCEGARSWFDMCVDRFKNVPRVSLILGKSTNVLLSMLPDKPAVVFLDAHPAGPLSFGHDDLMSDPANSEFKQDNIIKAELKILSDCGVKHLIIIDDVNGHADGYAEEYCKLIGDGYTFEFWDECLSGQFEYYYHDKILVAIPN